MAAQPDFFRDFGIIPYGVSAPPAKIRAYLPWRHVLGQYVATGLMACFGAGMAHVCAMTMPFPVNVVAVIAVLAGFGYLVFKATRNDYRWVELDGEILRAQHLYSRRIIERSIGEIDDLLTLVFQVRRLETRIAEAWLGRVRGIMIRFQDKRTPMQVTRTDPTMRNAKELIEGIIFRMSRMGEVDAEVIDFAGKPIIRRIHWKNPR
jgi:hypothetical protein